MFASVLDAVVTDVKPSAFPAAIAVSTMRRRIGLSACRANTDRVDLERELRGLSLRTRPSSILGGQRVLENALNLRVDRGE